MRNAEICIGNGPQEASDKLMDIREETGAGDDEQGMQEARAKPTQRNRRRKQPRLPLLTAYLLIYRSKKHTTRPGLTRMVQQAARPEEEAEAEEACYDDWEPAARFYRTHQEKDGPDPDRHTNIWQEYCNVKDVYSDFDL